MYDEPKFANIILGTDFDKIDSQLIQTLVSKSIIIEHIPEKWESLKMTNSGNSTEFDTNLLFDTKSYEINEEILIEIYERMEVQVENIAHHYVKEKAEITITVNSFITLQEKVEYLKQKHRELYSSVNLEPEFLFFMGFNEFNGFLTWRELVIDSLRFHPELIKNYLTTSMTTIPVPEHILEMWLRYGRVEKLTDTCNQLLAVFTDKNQPEHSETDKQNSLDSAQKVLLFDRLMRYANWDELSHSKKAFALNKLTGSNTDNLRKFFSALERQNTPKSENDNRIIDSIMNELGN